MIMKKKITMVLKSDKTETDSSELFIIRTVNPKMYRDHKIADYHVHGRANKFPFGSGHGPECF